MGSNPNAPDAFKIAPLHTAVMMNRPAVVRMLLNKGARIRSKTREKLTPLLCAAYFGHTECFNILHGAGASLEAGDCNGVTSLDLAKSRGHVKIVEYISGQAGH